MRLKPLVLLLFLTACASGAETVSQKVYASQATFNAYLGAIASYARQPVCTPVVVIACADGDVVSKLRELVVASRLSLDAARGALGTTGAAQAAAALGASVRALTAYLVLKGIGNAS